MTLDGRLYYLLSGGAAIAGWVCALFFFRFWRRTADRFFFFFGLSFLTMGLEKVASLFVDPRIEDQSPMFYLVRLASFLLILYAVLEKNRRPRLSRSPTAK
jgi:hypothetical protein